MGWSGIWLVAPGPGESAEEAIVRMTPNADGEQIGLDESTDRWIERIVDLLGRHNPWCGVVEEQRDGDHRRSVVLEDPSGPVSVTVHAGEVQLLPRAGWAAPPDRPGAGFTAMWEYCQLLANEGFVAHDPDDGKLIDLDLGPDEAARTYLWV
jgi:hypothetical protein